MLRTTLMLVLGALLLGGCAVRPIPVRPPAAVEAALAHPDVVKWHQSHSAASPRPVFRPTTVVTLAPEGLLVRFTAPSGPSPRRLEVVVDRTSGEVLEVKER